VVELDEKVFKIYSQALLHYKRSHSAAEDEVSTLPSSYLLDGRWKRWKGLSNGQLNLSE